MIYKYLLPFILIFTSLNISAEQRWFEVELLLFQRNVNINDVKEALATDNLAIDSSESIELIKTKNNPDCVKNAPCLHKENPSLIEAYQFASLENDFIRLDNKQLQLNELHQKLDNHRSFKPVLHLAWRMPIESGRTAKPIHLFAGKNFAFDLQKEQQKQSATLQAEDSSIEEKSLLIDNNSESQLVENMITTEPVAELLTDKWAIDGNFKIYLDHYLFIDSQLIIRQQVTETVQQQVNSKFEVVNSENDVEVINQKVDETAVEVIQETVLKEVLFDQNRRLRSEEIHYLDHPLMGIVVQIRKIPEDQLPKTEVTEVTE